MCPLGRVLEDVVVSWWHCLGGIQVLYLPGHRLLRLKAFYQLPFFLCVVLAVQGGSSLLPVLAALPPPLYHGLLAMELQAK